MKRLLFSTKAYWHARRWRTLHHRADRLMEAADAHGMLAEGYLIGARYLARAPLPAHENDADPAPPSGCFLAAQFLLAAIVGLFIAGLWIWFCARAGR